MFKRANTKYVNLIGMAAPLGVLFAAFLLNLNLSQANTWTYLLSAALILSLFSAIFNYWRLLRITEAPISTIAAAAQGYIELQGVASTQKTLKTPYHGMPCVWFRAWAYANRTEGALSNQPVDNRLVEYLESDNTFFLEDFTGRCMVDPNGAEVIFSQKRTYLKNEHRYVEEYLPAGKPIYVLGQLDTRHESFNQKEINKDVTNRLADLKRNQHKLLNRYDHDRNGKIDMDEWELARQDAFKEVKSAHAMKAHTGIFTLAKPTDNHLFLISSLSPKTLTDNYRHWAIAHLVILSILLIALFKLS